HPVGLDITLGLKDKQPTDWDGEVHVSEGKVLAVTIVEGNPKATATGQRFTVRSFRRPKVDANAVYKPILRVSLDAPPSATVTFKTTQGKFTVALADLGEGKAKTYLNGQVSVERADGALKITRPGTEDDYPALARGAGGTVWLAYLAYQPG